MPTLYGAHTSPRSTTPPGQLDGSVQGGHVRIYREKITLAAQTPADTIVVAFPSSGEMFLGGALTTDVSLGAAQIAIGVNGNTAKYKALGTLTQIDAPVLFGKAAAQASKLVSDETIFLSIATANLPAAGTLIVDLYFAQT